MWTCAKHWCLALALLSVLSSCIEVPNGGTASVAPPGPAVDREVAEIRGLADTGDAEARNQLGLRYSEGRGLPQDYVQAKRWFQLAADQGHAGAQVNLGTLYFLGQGAPESDQMALSWFRRAAEQRSALAFAKLGLMYAQGRGVPQDFIDAHMWYNLSASHGEKRALESRDALAKHMTPAQIAEAQRKAREWAPKAK